MEFYADHELLDFIDDELVAFHDRFPEVSATAVFETTSGARRHLSSIDRQSNGAPVCGGRCTATTFETASVIIEFEHSTTEPSDASVDAMHRVAQRIRLVVEPHLRLHLERELSGRRRAPHEQRGHRHAHP